MLLLLIGTWMIQWGPKLFPDSERLLVLFGATLVYGTWLSAAIVPSRLLLVAHELRVPGVSRTFSLTVLGLAAWTFVVMCAPSVVWSDAPAPWPELILLMICMGCLHTLSSGWLQALIGEAVTLVLLTAWFHWPWAPSREALTILSVAMLLVLAWRIAAVARAVGRGSWPALLGKEVEGRAGREAVPFFGRTRAQGGRHGARSPAAVLHTALGPLYGLRTMLRPAAELAISLGVLSVLTGTFRAALIGYTLMVMPITGGAWLLSRLQRLAALLHEPSAEIAELALLPGAGDRKEQGRALLREALLRPLAWGALLLGVFVALYSALLEWAHAEPAATLSAVLLSAGLLLLFAALTMGVLSRKLRSLTLSLALGAPFIFSPAVLLAVRDLSAHGGSLSVGQGLAWLLTLGPIAAVLIAWARLTLRREWLLYQ